MPDDVAREIWRPTILVVVGEPRRIGAIERAAATHGVAVVPCGSREEAIRALADDRSYAALVTDPRIQGAEGNEGLKLIRHVRTTYPTIPILGITSPAISHKEEGVSCAALRAGIRDLLFEPLSDQELEQAIAELIPMQIQSADLVPCSRRLLIVDADPEALAMATEAARRIGYAATAVGSFGAAREALHGDTPWSGVLVDPCGGTTEGPDFLRSVRSSRPALPMVCFAPHGNERLMARAWQSLIREWVFKPATPDELLVSLREALPLTHQGVRTDPAFAGLWAADPIMLETYDRARALARQSSSVLICGETGAGKEGIARMIHAKSHRRGAPWLAVNAANLRGDLLQAELFGIVKRSATGVDARPGLLVQAHGGTLLIDELQDMDPECQARLLRFLATGEVLAVGGDDVRIVEVRILAATNRDLEACSTDGPAVRIDLLKRLRDTLEVPPLRRRPLDVALLARRLGEEIDVELGQEIGEFEPAAIEALQAYSWPGNVRDLRSVVAETRRAHAGRHVRAASLPRRIARVPDAEGKRKRGPHVSREDGARTLRAHDGNYEQAARTLGIHLKSLYRLVPVAANGNGGKRRGGRAR